jgi:hypothetical protein
MGRGYPASTQVYQLRAVLRGIRPLIWRRLLLRADSTIADLHRVLQLYFGWSDAHLHRCKRSRNSRISRSLSRSGIRYHELSGVRPAPGVRGRPADAMAFSEKHGTAWDTLELLLLVAREDTGRLHAVRPAVRDEPPPRDPGGRSARVHRDTSDRFFTTYNRTDDANRVQDILTALAWLKRQPAVRSVSLVGLERAGLWCLLAQALAPGLDAVVADADAFATERGESWLEHVFVPLLRSVGGFETALTLGLGSRLRIRTAGVFDTAAVEASARAVGAAERLRVSRETLGDADVVAWVTAQ